MQGQVDTRFTPGPHLEFPAGSHLIHNLAPSRLTPSSHLPGSPAGRHLVHGRQLLFHELRQCRLALLGHVQGHLPGPGGRADGHDHLLLTPLCHTGGLGVVFPEPCTGTRASCGAGRLSGHGRVFTEAGKEWSSGVAGAAGSRRSSLSPVQAAGGPPSHLCRQGGPSLRPLYRPTMISFSVPALLEESFSMSCAHPMPSKVSLPFAPPRPTSQRTSV